MPVFSGFGGMDHGGHVAVGDQAHGGAGLAHRRDHVGMARPVEQHRRDALGLDALGFGERADVLVGRRVEVDHVLGIAGPDRDLVHIDVGRVQQCAALGDGDGGDGARHVLGAQRRAFQRIDRDVDLEAALGADLLADEQHRRFVHLAFADHHRAVDRQIVELAPHGVDRRLIGRLLLAAAAQPRGIDGRALGHPHDLHRENAVKHQVVRYGDRRRHFFVSPSCSMRGRA